MASDTAVRSQSRGMALPTGLDCGNILNRGVVHASIRLSFGSHILRNRDLRVTVKTPSLKDVRAMIELGAPQSGLPGTYPHDGLILDEMALPSWRREIFDQGLERRDLDL